MKFLILLIPLLCFAEDWHPPMNTETGEPSKAIEHEVQDSTCFFWRTTRILKIGDERCWHDWGYSGVTVNTLYPPYRYRACSKCGRHEREWKEFYEQGDPEYTKTIRRTNR